MRRGGGKQKGAKFERDICVALSKAVSRGRRKDLYWRSAMSGGRATVMGRRGDRNTAQAGDISAVASEGAWLTEKYVIECKHRKDICLTHFLLNGLGPIQEFLIKGEGEALGSAKEFLLIAKENRLPTLVFTRSVCLEGPHWGVPMVGEVVTRGGVKVFTFDHLLACISKSCQQVRRRRLAP